MAGHSRGPGQSEAGQSEAFDHESRVSISYEISCSKYVVWHAQFY